MIVVAEDVAAGESPRFVFGERCFVLEDAEGFVEDGDALFDDWGEAWGAAPVGDELFGAGGVGDIEESLHPDDAGAFARHHGAETVWFDGIGEV